MWLLQGTARAALWLFLKSPSGPRSTYFPGRVICMGLMQIQHLAWRARYGSGTKVTEGGGGGVGLAAWVETQSPFPIQCLRHTVAMSITDSQGAMCDLCPICSLL